jgi:hypothetical protein
MPNRPSTRAVYACLELEVHLGRHLLGCIYWHMVSTYELALL